MPCDISLDSPLLEQQSVREMLNWVTEGVNESIKLEDLIKIARTVVQSELVDYGYDENELTGLKLSYTVTHPQSENLQKVYSIEWNLPQAEIASRSIEKQPEVSTAFESKPSISTQLMSRLFTRLEEARTSTDTANTSASTLMATYRNNETNGVTFRCEVHCGDDGDNGDDLGCAEYSVDDNGNPKTFIRCRPDRDSMCLNTSPNIPD